MIHYPGSKQKLARIIVPALLSFGRFAEYREPFCGTCSVGLRYLRSGYATNAWINDIDRSLMAAWDMIVNDPEPLIRRIQRFQPSVEKFYDYKERLLINNQKPQNAAFQRLAIHAMSYGALGVKAATPMGGNGQHKTYNVDSRWNPPGMIKQIRKAHSVLTGLRGEVRITAGDYEPLILDESIRALLYVDPPYVGKGYKVYQYSFNEAQHIRLAELLKHTRHSWLLSYDDCDFIRELYSWAQIASVPVTYTICKAIRTRELLIWR